MPSCLRICDLISLEIKKQAGNLISFEAEETNVEALHIFQLLVKQKIVQMPELIFTVLCSTYPKKFFNLEWHEKWVYRISFYAIGNSADQLSWRKIQNENGFEQRPIHRNRFCTEAIIIFSLVAPIGISGKPVQRDVQKCGHDTLW